MRLSTWSMAVAAAYWATMATAMSLAEVPACGLQCAVKVVSASVCKSIANTACLCSNQPVDDALSACVLGSCSIRETLAMKKFSDVLCDRPIVDNSNIPNIIAPLFGSLALLCFAVRVLARWQNGLRTSWRLDDWLIVPAVVATMALASVCTIISYTGLGRDMWWLTGDELSNVLYWIYWAELLYSVIVGLTKMSVLAFYLQIFPNKTVRYGSYFLMACNAGYIISTTLAIIFQCDPIPGAWLAWDGTVKAKCINLSSLVWAAAFLCIVFDVATLALPMPALWKLNMSTRKKTHVMIMFGLGLFVTIVSMIRLQSIAILAKTTNVTQGFLPVGVWSVIEACVGIICACLPAMRVVLNKLLPKVFGNSSGGTSVKQHYYGGSKYGPGGAGGGGSSSGQMMSHTEPPHIRVKSEFTVRSRRRDERSFVELDDLSTGLPPGQDAQAGDSGKEGGIASVIVTRDLDRVAGPPVQHAMLLDSLSERPDSSDAEAEGLSKQPAVACESPLSVDSRRYSGRADTRNSSRR